MTTRKKSNAAARQQKSRPPPAAPAFLDIEAILRIGQERVLLDDEENDNVYFMSEVVDTM
ncbi:hypothetical protein [Duganella sp. BuS-21]|uniref:hypothetical protein n=1 Tax=Duganella sp. BuS-21 TaxID=2943848 RepID=UPI0035A6E941